MSKPPVKVTVTGAAGQIGYSLLFRIASGQMLGADQPVILQLLELPAAQEALKGVVMELDDCAFPLLAGVVATDDATVAFQDADVALLVGARPRGAGMERKDLLTANGKIFIAQGEAIGQHASPDVRVLVVGNPCNTNCYIATQSAVRFGRVKARNFTAMLRLDHNRALTQLAQKTGQPVGAFRKLIVWGNHSPTMVPDFRFATVEDRPVPELVTDTAWARDVFIPTVGQRGAAVIKARGLSSAASAANAAIDHMRDWWLGSSGEWVTMGVPSDGAYGIPEGIVYGVPCTTADREYRIVPELAIDAFTRGKMEVTLAELEAERAAVRDMLS